MYFTKRYLLGLAGAMALVGLAGTANAAVELNVGGSSAGTNFATDVPLNLCDASPLPERYSSANKKMVTWSCKRGAVDHIIRYAATSSKDGILKLQVLASNSASNLNFLDHTLTAGCTGPTLTTRTSDSKQYNNTTGCSDANTIAAPVILGAVDVQGASFHQSGGGTVTPLDDSSGAGIASTKTAVVPFSIFVGKGVVKLDSLGTGPNGPIDGLSRLQLEQILAHSVTDWRTLGYGTVTDANPTVLEATSPIGICGRAAGSGTKATLDETIMINATETPLFETFNTGTADVVICMTGNRKSIGYMDADQLVTFQTAGTNFGTAYPVRVDGGLAYDASLTDPKRDLKCGRYPYWAAWRLNKRTSSEGSDIDLVRDAFITNAGLQTTISIIPTGAFWASDEEMFVSKIDDRGPLNWKAGAHPECR
jgi:hypothetical protein